MKNNKCTIDDSQGKYPKTLFRNDDISEGQTNDIIEIMTYEICELGNSDTLDYCIDHYKLSGKVINQAEQLIQMLDEGECLDIDEDGDKVRNICRQIIAEVSKLTNINVKFGLWLTDKESVIELYDGTEDNISEYKTSEAVISDLGSDGVLFGYEEMPEEIV